LPLFDHTWAALCCSIRRIIFVISRSGGTSRMCHLNRRCDGPSPYRPQ